METKPASLLILHLHLAAFCLYFTAVVVADELDSIIYDPRTEDTLKFGEAQSVRYLLYDVNPGEGFNLRRDVYMRVANLVHVLNKESPWVLVLPPWGRLYHWRSNRDQYQKWSTFFDLESLRRHVPVIEFEDYLKVRGASVIDEVYYLQRYKEGWTGGTWQEKLDERDCIDDTGFEKEGNQWDAWFWGYSDVKALKFKCLSVQAEAVFMKSFLLENTTGRCVFFVRGEQLIHGQYSEWSSMWWTARRSLVFAKHLKEIGNEFRESELNSTDENDNTIWEDDWTQMERKSGEAVGGPYLGVHWRRQDFAYAHSVPSIEDAAKQIKKYLKKYNLSTVFIATDAPQTEFEDLQFYLKKYKVVRYTPSSEVLDKYKDGGVAIIDQWIAAHARVFVGTAVSTFSFRINEEREIMGFDPHTTFNCLCPDEEKKCEQPTKWRIKYN